MSSLLVGLLIGLAVGGILGWVLGLAQRNRLRGDVAVERERAGAANQLFSEASMRLQESFKQLSDEGLDRLAERARSDLDAREKAVGDLVKPVTQSLERIDNYMRDIEKQRVGAYGALREYLELMKGTQAELRRETGNLVKALRSPTVRGRWGEIQLKRVVELAGMVEHCDFDEQKTISTEDGRIRPDVIVRLPGGKTLIVDAKAPVSAYLEAVEAEDDAIREEQLEQHARQVREHITRLASKSYWEQFDASPEFVVMFLPGETFFSAALQKDPTLIEYGVTERVIPASPTTLIALLRAVAYGWRQEVLAENALQISSLGRELYERLRIWLDHMSRVGKNLGEAVGAYNDAAGSLEHRVLVSARRFQDLGVVTKDDLGAAEPVQRSVRSIEASASSADHQPAPDSRPEPDESDR